MTLPEYQTVESADIAECFDIQYATFIMLAVVGVCKHISRFSEISSGLVCELEGEDIARAANCQLARSAELPSHRVSGYLKSCAAVCLRQPCLCCVPGGAEGGRVLMGALTDNEGFRRGEG